MANREFTNINGIKVCDQTARDKIPTKTSQLENDSDYATITQVNQAINNAQLGGGEVDLSGYVTKETGNANQITFSDGQTFQAKLDAGTLKGDKGDKGDPGKQGPQGIQGEKGDKGDPGESSASNINDTTASATTTYSSNKIENIKENLSSQIREIKNNGVTSSTVGASFSSWLAIGDSITVGYNNNNYSYADIIAEKYGIYMVKDAVTGSNIASQGNFGPGFVHRVDNDGINYNLVTVMGGLNDFGHATVRLGTFNPDIAITGSIINFYDGVTILCKKLITKYPNSKIVFLSSNRDDTYNNKNGESYEQFMEAIDTVCSYFSIPFYRIDTLCGFNRDVYKNQGIDNGDLNTDDIHPKTLGHRKIAGAICDCINFVNPVDAWGKGTLNITQLSSTIASDATMSDVRGALTVKIVYENGVEFTITDYNITGNITEGTTTFTIDYRGITSTVTFTVGEATGSGITPVYQMSEPYVFSGTGNLKYDTGFVFFNEKKAVTLQIAGKINSFDNTNYITVVSASNPGAPVQFTGFSMTASQLSTKGFTVYSSSLKQDYDIRGISWAEGYYFNIFITYDGGSTVSIYAVENGAIKSSRTNLNIEFHESYFGNNWTLKLLSTGVDSSNGADGEIDILRVYDTAFTEQDVLNNI